MRLFGILLLISQEILTALALTEAIYRVVQEGRDAAAAYFERLLAELDCSSVGATPDIWWSSDEGTQRCNSLHAPAFRCF